MNWRRMLAGSAILLLVFIGGFSAWQAAHPFSLVGCLFALAVTWGPAAAYALAYFRIFPEALGAEARLQKDSLPSRWSSFARMATGVAIVITWACWAFIAAKHYLGMVVRLGKPPSIVNLFVLGTLTTRPDLCIFGAFLAAALMTLCVVTSEAFLARTMGTMSVCSPQGWRSVVMKVVGVCGRWLAKLLRPRFALVLAGLLLLFSLIARMDLFGGYGFEVVTGEQIWPTAEYTLVDPALVILSEAGRWMYITVLIIAALALLAAAVGRFGNRLRTNYALAFASTVIALFALCDLTLGVARLNSTIPPLLNFVVLAIVWALPIAVWMLRAYGDRARWNQSCIAIMILYFPVVLSGLALIPLALILVPSYACFLLGTGFLALGFLRSRWEAAVRPIQVESESQISTAA
jgi:hypothetical protein